MKIAICVHLIQVVELDIGESYTEFISLILVSTIRHTKYLFYYDLNPQKPTKLLKISS